MEFVEQQLLSYVGAPVGPDVIEGYAEAYQYVLTAERSPAPAATSHCPRSPTRNHQFQQLNFLHAYNPLFRVVIPTYDFLYPSALTPRQTSTTTRRITTTCSWI